MGTEGVERKRVMKKSHGKDEEMKREANRRTKTTKGALTGGSNSERARSRSEGVAV